MQTLLVLLFIGYTFAVPGGFIETCDEFSVNRTALTTTAQLPFVPATRGEFTFPAPYNTVGIRITLPSDCGGTNCVNYVGYSYWRNINNHVNSNKVHIFLGLSGGRGPTLFSYDKTTGQVANEGPLFNDSNTAAGGEGWYFSARLESKLYILNWNLLRRYDIFTRTYSTVFDSKAIWGSSTYLWQCHSSSDDNVHSCTLRNETTYEEIGCVVYRESDSQSFIYPVNPTYRSFDECQIDRSGRWLLIKEQTDGLDGEDNRIIDLQTQTEKILLDRNGAAGHSDNNFGFFVAADNWGLPGEQRLWNFSNDPMTSNGNGIVAYRGGPSWQNIKGSPAHVSMTHARSDLPFDRQFVCGSGISTSLSEYRSNEIICFKTDASCQVLVVAPVMTDPTGLDYSIYPKGNLDPTGRYFIWTTNLGGSGRLDAFLVKVPYESLGIPTYVAESTTGSVTTGSVTTGGITTCVPACGENENCVGGQCVCQTGYSVQNGKCTQEETSEAAKLTISVLFMILVVLY